MKGSVAFNNNKMCLKATLDYNKYGKRKLY